MPQKKLNNKHVYPKNSISEKKEVISSMQSETLRSQIEKLAQNHYIILQKMNLYF